MHRKNAQRIRMNDSVPPENETSMTPMNDNSGGDANDSYNACTLYNQASQIQEGRKEQVVEENDNLLFRKSNSEKRKLSKQSEPGCSKDSDVSVKEQGLYDVEELKKESRLIHTLLPEFSYNSILFAQFKNQYAKNCTELTLWDLLPVHRPVPQPLKRRKDSDEMCYRT